MTDTITVICPKCHVENTIATPSHTGCRVECLNCLHKFTVVSKNSGNKTATSSNRNEEKQNNFLQDSTVPNADEVMNMLSNALGANQNLLSKRTRKNPHEQSVNIAPSGNIRTVEKCPNLNTLLNQSTRRIEIPIPVEQQAEPLKQMDPLHNLNPTAAIVNNPPNITTTPIHIPENSSTNIEMNGNIGNLNNLVFTLLPSETQKQADIPLLLNDAIEKTDAIHAKTEFLHHQQDKLTKEFNWTLATIVALTVLIMQLFYLMAVR